jgi:type I restriction enzyme S subunit
MKFERIWGIWGLTSEIPTVQIKAIADVIMGQSPSSDSCNVTGEGLPFYQGVTDFGALNPNPRMYCDNPKRIAEIDDILFSVRAPIARINVANHRCATGRGIAIIRAKKKSDQLYLRYAIESIWWYWNSLEGSGAIFSNAKKDDILNAEIPWGDEKYRNKITAQLSSLEGLTLIHVSLISNLRDIVQSVFRSWFIDFDPVKAKAAGKLPYGMDEKTAALFPDTFKNTEYGSIPNGWSVTKVSELCKSVDYGFTANSTEDSSGQKFLRITDIIPKQINWNSVPYCQISDDLLSKYRIESGDIVIARTGAGVGVAKRIHNPPVDAVFASYLVRVKPKNTVLSIYLGTWLESEQYQYYIQGISYGAGQPQCSAKYLVTFDLVLPPIEILIAFNERIKSLLDLQDYTTYQTNTLVKTRDTLLPRLMSGEIGV